MSGAIGNQLNLSTQFIFSHSDQVDQLEAGAGQTSVHAVAPPRRLILQAVAALRPLAHSVGLCTGNWVASYVHRTYPERRPGGVEVGGGHHHGHKNSSCTGQVTREPVGAVAVATLVSRAKSAVEAVVTVKGAVGAVADVVGVEELKAEEVGWFVRGSGGRWGRRHRVNLWM
jgi:hypothetical protein